MKNLSTFVLLLFLLHACAQPENKQLAQPANGVGPDSSTSKIPPAELIRLRNRVKGHLDSAFGTSHMNGSILVAKNGEIIFEEYTGYANPRIKKDSITATTPFHLASVSKTFTGMATLKLMEMGKLSLDDSVTRYLPGFPCTGVTIRMLLNHRSGIPKYDHYMENLGWNKRQMVTNQDVLDFIIARHKDIRIGRPDRGFSYSNTNFVLLALIIERASGMLYKDFMQKTFFEPLGMKDTYVFTMADSARYLASYYYNGRPYRFDYLDLVYGDKNIYSTVRDLLKWDQALHSDSFFKKETLEAAYSGYSFEKPGTHNYGLGWRMYMLKNGKKLIYHNGWWHGNRTVFYRMLDEDATIIALCNNDYKNVYTVKEMADIFGNYMQSRDHSNDLVVARTSPRKKIARHRSKSHSKSTISKKKPQRRSNTAKN